MAALGLLKLIIFIAVFDFAFCSKYCDKEFRRREYIPQFADGLKNTKLKVQYNDHVVKCGETVALTEALLAPTLTYDLTDKCVNVTVLGLAPDIILNPPFLTWLVFNVPSSALKNGFNNGGDITDRLAGRKNVGDVIGSYIAPDDPTSQVRGITLIYFVFCQCRYIFEEVELDKIDRFNFEDKSYMKDHGLKCPVTGMYHHVTATGLPPPDLPVHVTPLQAPLPSLPKGTKVPLVGKAADPKIL